MRLSAYFLPTLKETPADAQIVSHRLMLRSGLVRQCGSGIYTWLPAGLRVLKKIENIIRDEQAAAGALEVLMPTVQHAELWKESGRYDDYGAEMLRFKDRHDREMLYGPTNEEMITDIFRKNVTSYRQLPLNLYQIQWKFRDEIRPRFGVMRGREFLMKDGYSFDISKAAAELTYKKNTLAYLKTFARMGLTAIPTRADTGPIGGELSHEFLILAETGESAIYFDNQFTETDFSNFSVDYRNHEEIDRLYTHFTGIFAVTDEKYDEAEFFKAVPPERRIQGRGVEVGHIFYFGTKYSTALGANVTLKEGETIPAEMGSYGIGVSRLVGAILEAHHDDKGAVWPAAVAPFHVNLLNLRQGSAEIDGFCDTLYERLQNAGADILYDDTDERAGAKFNRADLLGLPFQAAIGPKSAEKGLVEVKDRKSGRAQELSIDETVNYVRNAIGS